MNSGHFIEVCSCGEVLAQCRCADCNKMRIVRQKACAKCRKEFPSWTNGPEEKRPGKPTQPSGTAIEIETRYYCRHHRFECKYFESRRGDCECRHVNGIDCTNPWAIGDAERAEDYPLQTLRIERKAPTNPDAIAAAEKEAKRE